MKLIKILISIIGYIISLGIIITTSLKIALYFYVAKPIAKEIAYDVTTYVEANDRFFTAEMLKSYVARYKTSNRWVKVKYTQYAQDRRFSVNVSVNADFGTITSPTAYFQTQSINLGDTPTRSVNIIYDSFYSDTKSGNENKSIDTKLDTDLETRPENSIKKKANDDTVDNQSNISEDEIKDFVQKYVVLGIEAIKKDDFSYVEHLLDPNGKIYYQSQNSIDNINSKGIKEELLKFQAKDVIEIDQSNYKVFTYEEYKITYKDGTEMIKGYNSKYLVKKLGDQRLVMNDTLQAEKILNQEVHGENEVASVDILKQTCMACHGGDLEGGVGPTLHNLEQRYTEDEVVNIIENGKGYMPSGLVTKEQARNVAQYIMENY
ncbi:c-type cytochrome [Actinomycetes bacterium NPDC127524]